MLINGNCRMLMDTYNQTSYKIKKDVVAIICLKVLNERVK